MNESSVLSMIAIVSAVLTAKAAMDCAEHSCKGNLPWAVACGGGSLLICLIVLTLLRGKMEGGASKFLALFMFAWWTAGAGILTFSGPYTYMGNAYLACWIAFLLAANLFLSAFGTGMGGQSWLGILLMASGVELTQAALDCKHGCSDYRAYAVAVGGVSSAFCLGILLVAQSKGAVPHLKMLAIFLFVWWIAGWGIMTFKAPYLGGGNGFFSSWVALLAVSALFVEYGLGRGPVTTSSGRVNGKNYGSA